jgi:4-hydroxybenzoate polyprenyltransferase
MLVVMLCAQCAIGVTNDIFDRELDDSTKPWKPIPARLVAPATAIWLAALLIAATAAVAASFGRGSFALAMLGMACGLAYDVKLKRTVFSAVPYMIAIPTLPLWVWLTLDAWQPVMWWLVPLGALIGLSLHLANTVPDIEGDAAHGVAGLPHRLGARSSTLVAWASFAAALAMSVLLAAFVAYDLRVYVPVLIVGVAALAASGGVYAARQDTFAMQFGFSALSFASAILAVGWLAAVT